MATCDLDALLAQACANRFTCLSPSTAGSVALQLWYEAADETATVEQLLEQSCKNKFSCLDPNTAFSVWLQLLCNLAGGVASFELTLSILSLGEGTIGWTWDGPNPDNWQIQRSLGPNGPWNNDSLLAPEERVETALTGVNYYRVVAVGGQFAGTTSNVVFLSQ